VRGPSTFAWAAHKAAADMGRGVRLVMMQRVGFRRCGLAALEWPSLVQGRITGVGGAVNEFPWPPEGQGVRPRQPGRVVGAAGAWGR
jgi:hypothetical protein